MTVVSLDMAYCSFREVLAGLDTRLDTPPSIDSHHPDSGLALGLVASLNRPGGNVTGGVVLTSELAQKRLQLLRELIPDTTLFGVVADPTFPATQSVITNLQAAARTLGLQLIILYARTDSDLQTAYETFSQQQVGGVLISGSTFLVGK